MRYFVKIILQNNEIMGNCNFVHTFIISIGNGHSSDILSKVRTVNCQVRIINFARKFCFAKSVDGLLVLKLVQLSSGNIVLVTCLQQLQTLCSACNPIIPNLRQGARTPSMLS